MIFRRIGVKVYGFGDMGLVACSVVLWKDRRSQILGIGGLRGGNYSNIVQAAEC